MKRRDFFRTGIGAVVTVSVAPAIAGEKKPIPKRPYKEGIELSSIGFGGIVVIGMEQDTANRVVAESFERGINYYDVAPTYGDGEAEEKLGKALQPFRKKVFLACKPKNGMPGERKKRWRFRLNELERIISICTNSML